MADPTVIRDQQYSFEIARRAVGRAALHLGIDSMTEQALDVMADVLLQFLARTGRALSHLAESSRRTSAHVNVLDAFQACQLVASPAVGRLHLQEEEEEDIVATTAPKPPDSATVDSNGNGNTVVASAASGSGLTNGGTTQPNSNPSHHHSSTGWKSLAQFVFGQKWLQEKDEEEILRELAAKNGADSSNGEGRELSSSGGKVFPSSLENGDSGDSHGGVGDIGTLGRKRKKGWDAPYPEEVPAFPRASSTCANPHSLPARVTGGTTAAAVGSSTYRKVDVDADEADENEQDILNELEELSDKVFLQYPEAMVSDFGAVGDSTWGSIDGKKIVPGSTSTKDDDSDVEMQPITKKVKLEDGTAKAGKGALRKTGIGAFTGRKTTLGGKDETADNPNQKEFSYIPTFYPRPPSKKVVIDDRRTVVDSMDDRQQRLLEQQRTQEQQEQQVFASEAIGDDMEGTSMSLRNDMKNNLSGGVRSSLIRLGSNNYWGSGWDKASSSATSAPTLSVPMGRKVSGPSTSGGAGARSTPDDPIIPMSRASGSRVSRVLEGSMDAAAMQ